MAEPQYKLYTGKQSDSLKNAIKQGKVSLQYAAEIAEEEAAKEARTTAAKNLESAKSKKNKLEEIMGFLAEQAQAAGKGVKESYERGSLVNDAGGTLFGASSRLVNQGLGIIENTGGEIASAVTGNEQIKKDIKKRIDEEILAEGKGLFGQGGIYNSVDELKNADVGEVTRKAVGTGIESITEKAAPLRGIKAFKAGGGVVKNVAKGVGENAILGGVGNAANQFAEDGDIDLEEVRNSAVLGGVAGGVFAGAGAGIGKLVDKVRGGAKLTPTEEAQLAELPAGEREQLLGLPQGDLPTEAPQGRLGEGSGDIQQSRIDELEAEALAIRSGDYTGLTQDTKVNAGKKGTTVETQDPGKASEQTELARQADEAEQEIKRLNDMKASSPYHRAVDKVEAQRLNELDEVDRMREEGFPEDALNEAVKDINARYDPEIDRLNQKYPNDALEAPVLNDSLMNVTQARMDAEAKLQASVSSEMNAVGKLGAADTIQTPDATTIKARLDEIEAEKAVLAQEQADIKARKVEAERPKEPSRGALYDLQTGNYDAETRPDLFNADGSANGPARVAEFKKLNTQVRETENTNTATTPVKEGKRPTHEEVRNVIDESQNVIEIPNNRKNFLLDLFELPSEYLRYRGLSKTAEKVEDATMNYRRANYDDMKQFKEWKSKVKDSTANLFRAANGDKDAYSKLSPAGADAVDEWSKYAKGAAEELGLPADSRITDYIPHLFAKGGRETVGRLVDLDAKIAKQIDKVENGGLTGKDLNIAKSVLKKQQEQRIALIDVDNVELNKFFKDTGKVKNQFLEKRTGAEGYKEDFWAAVQVYSMQKNRKVHIEPASKQLVQIADTTADTNMSKWLTNYADQLRGAKNGIDSAIDNAIEGQIGKANLGTKVLRGYKDVSSMAKLGFNLGSVVNSTMQAINVAPVIGARAATEGTVGALALLGRISKNKLTKQDTEMFSKMVRDGVFEGSSQILSEKTMNKYYDNFNKVAYSGITGADRFMRMTSYLGAMEKGKRQGLSGQDLDRYAYRMSNKVNQNFDSLVVPSAFRSQVARTLGSLVTFAPGQLIRSGEVAVGSAQGAVRLVSGKSISQKTFKEDIDKVAKTLYMAGGMYAMGGVIGSITGNSESVPNPLKQEFYSTPALQLLFGSDTKTGILGLLPSDADKEGDYNERLGQFFGEVLPSFIIPGYGQANKTLVGMETSEKGYSETANGGIRFQTNPENDLQRNVFGQYSTEEGQEYIKNMNKETGGALTATQSEKVLEADPAERDEYMNFYLTARKVTGRTAANKEITDLYQAGEAEKARRKAAEFNDKVDTAMAEYYAKYPDIDEDLLDELNGNLYINITPRGEKQRASYK